MYQRPSEMLAKQVVVACCVYGQDASCVPCLPLATPNMLGVLRWYRDGYKGSAPVPAVLYVHDHGSLKEALG